MSYQFTWNPRFKQPVDIAQITPIYQKSSIPGLVAADLVPPGGRLICAGEDAADLEALLRLEDVVRLNISTKLFTTS